MNIVLWIGNEANQKALANKLHRDFSIVGIVTESRKTKRKLTIPKLINKISEKVQYSAIDKAWFGMKSVYEQQFPDYPDVARIDVENINASEVYDFSLSLQPDLIIVSGTRLIKEKLLSIQPSIGIINLHTGLSPYIKGGPNCTNWCISTKQSHLIGNTIMWIDIGIDTGNIITTEFTTFEGNETLIDIHLKVMEHAHELYLKAVKHLNAGNRSNVKQADIAEGKTYYTKQWQAHQKKQLLANMDHFRMIHSSNNLLKELRNQIKTVSID